MPGEVVPVVPGVTPGVPPGIAPGELAGLPGVTVLGGENGPVGVAPGVVGEMVPPGVVVVVGDAFGFETMFGLGTVVGVELLMMFGFGADDCDGFTMPGVGGLCAVLPPRPVPGVGGAASDDELFNVEGLIVVTPKGIGTRIGCTVVDGEPGVTVPLGLPGAPFGGEFCASIAPSEA